MYSVMAVDTSNLSCDVLLSPSLLSSYQLIIRSYLIGRLFINMPRQSNDEDLVTYTISKPTKGPAPDPPPLPAFEPLTYAPSANTPRLPPYIDTSDPEDLFSLFIDDKAIEIIVNATNQNAKLKKAKFDADRDARRATNLLEGSEVQQRRWRDVTPDEILAYLGISMWMGCQRLKSIREYWNTQPEKGGVFDLIR